MNTSNSLQQWDNYDIFISYSRKDKKFVRQLIKHLKLAKLKIWIDWNILPGENWRQEIHRGIEAANNFIFIISSHSIYSKVCREELDHAIKNGKRLVPILRQDIESKKIHEELRKINWISFQESDDFNEAFRKLINAIKTDLNHIREHTHLLMKAIKWQKEGRNKSYLLQGLEIDNELYKAVRWLEKGENKQPQATALHREYINISLWIETERKNFEVKLRHPTQQQITNREAIVDWTLNKIKKALLD